MRHAPSLLTLATACALLSGCAGTYALDARRDVADGIARGGRMTAETMPAGMFNLATWQRIQNPGAVTRVYIEGDGYAWRSKHDVSPNPTPLDPLTLRLAAEDVAENVVYIARPCQYAGPAAGGACPEKYWTSARTAPEVIAAYQMALDALKARGATGFELVGYSGGAAVAVLVAGERNDVLSLRTVAGNTDYGAFARLHDTSPLSASIAPESAAMKVAHIPQLHFTGERDAVIPQDIFSAWKAASRASPCVRHAIVPGNTHDGGWVGGWPDLVAMPVACETNP